MSKLFVLAAAAAFVVLSGTSFAAEDSCVLIDFTAITSEFDDLNAAIGLIKTAKSANLLGSTLGKYDPLVLSNIDLRGFNYSVLGKDLTIDTAIDSINITGLTNLIPQHINVTSPNSVNISSYSGGHVSVDATLSATDKGHDVSGTANLKFVLKRPTLVVNIEADMYACAPNVPASLCSNMTVAELQTTVASGAITRKYAGVMKEVLMKFKDASVNSFTLDFESISDFDLDFDSSSFVFRTLLRLVPDYSATEINKKGTTYESYIATINEHAPTLLNYLIITMLKPWFGETCLSEK